jgi:N-acetylglucosamine kinase-like BadF-type ATPase
MLGAARALCGSEPGIACILGTGSNSCFYDGNDITENVVSLGYLLGDEGSGAHMGKQLITDYFHKNIPSDIVASFNKMYNPTVEFILDSVYNQPRPSRFLASFSPFLLENINNPYIRNLVTNSFDEFFRKNVSKYSNYQTVKINFTGSVAFFFSEVLKESAQKAGITTNKIYRSAIEGLIDFHKN